MKFGGALIILGGNPENADAKGLGVGMPTGSVTFRFDMTKGKGDPANTAFPTSESANNSCTTTVRLTAIDNKFTSNDNAGTVQMSASATVTGTYAIYVMGTVGYTRRLSPMATGFVQVKMPTLTWPPNLGADAGKSGTTTYSYSTVVSLNANTPTPIFTYTPDLSIQGKKGDSETLVLNLIASGVLIGQPKNPP
jgi:hypothetical protein